MFDIGWSELLIIGIVALIAIGPKELPAVLRTVGQYMGKIRRMASEFQGQFQDAMREAEMADVKKEFDEMSEAASDLTNFDPMADVQKEIDAAMADKPPESSATETGTPPAAIDSASPEAAAKDLPAPGSPAVSVPQPASDETAGHADVAVEPEALPSKAGSGA
ncbi:MAG: Sec-independent protein translocase protein TatB [Xanthobacteraceae bacterium]